MNTNCFQCNLKKTAKNISHKNTKKHKKRAFFWKRIKITTMQPNFPFTKHACGI